MSSTHNIVSVIGNKNMDSVSCDGTNDLYICTERQIP